MGVVLVAGDDPDVRAALSETLQQAGYKVAAAANGAEALKYLHREAPPFLVIVDLKMAVTGSSRNGSFPLRGREIG